MDKLDEAGNVPAGPEVHLHRPGLVDETGEGLSDGAPASRDEPPVGSRRDLGHSELMAHRLQVDLRCGLMEKARCEGWAVAC
jgi:hypothetical protein